MSHQDISIQEQEHDKDLTSLTKPLLLEEAISMKIQLKSNKHTEGTMSVFLDKLIAVATKVSILENQVTELQETNKRTTEELVSCQKRNKKLSGHYYDLSDEIYYMQKDISRIDQYSRRQNIELLGLPKDIHNNDLQGKVIEILCKIGVDVKPEDIVAVHRLKGQRYPNVIIRFFDRNIVYECLQKKKNLSNIKEYKLFLTENLCENYKSIYDDCMKLKAEGWIKSLWTTNGLVHFKFNENDKKVIKLHHIMDIGDYFEEKEYFDDYDYISDYNSYNGGWDPRYDW